jgi:hypothetical protein
MFFSHISLEPPGGPGIQLHHRRKLLPAHRHTAVDQVREAVVSDDAQQIVKQRSWRAMPLGSLDKVENFAVHCHVSRPRQSPATVLPCDPLAGRPFPATER